MAELLCALAEIKLSISSETQWCLKSLESAGTLMALTTELCLQMRKVRQCWCSVSCCLISDDMRLDWPSSMMRMGLGHNSSKCRRPCLQTYTATMYEDATVQTNLIKNSNWLYLTCNYICKHTQEFSSLHLTHPSNYTWNSVPSCQALYLLAQDRGQRASISNSDP